MDELSDEAKEMLGALKADETPSEEASNRMWGAVAAGGAVGALAIGLGKGKILLLGGLGLAAVATAVVVMTGDGEGPAESGDSGRVVVVERDSASGDSKPEAAAPEEPSEVAEPEPEAVDPDPVPMPEVQLADDGGSSAKKAEKKTAGKAPKAARPDDPGPDDLERDLSMIGKAKKALRDGNAQAALKMLTQHTKDFPSSSFAEERDFLRMTALCRLGRKDEARRASKKFLKHNPNSALSPRVEKLCQEP